MLRIISDYFLKELNKLTHKIHRPHNLCDTNNAKPNQTKSNIATNKYKCGNEYLKKSEWFSTSKEHRHNCDWMCCYINGFQGIWRSREKLANANKFIPITTTNDLVYWIMCLIGFFFFRVINQVLTELEYFFLVIAINRSGTSLNLIQS